MKKVFFINGWGESPDGLLKRYSQQTPKGSGIWEDIRGVSDIEDADYYVILDRTKLDIGKLDWSRVIYLQREPIALRSPFLNHKFPDNILYNGTYKNCHHAQTWWINVPFDDLVNLPYPKKTKKISTVTSGLGGANVYRDRLRFLRRFIDHYKNIDVYGRGTGSVAGSSYKGELNYNGKCKLKGHIDYEYSIVLENTLIHNTWSEKPCDSFLSWSLPIYSGASNFGEYFPKESFCQVDVNNCNLQEVVEFISEPPSKLQIEALTEARHRLLFQWNIWPAIKRILDERT